jgi:hypothetical protein
MITLTFLPFTTNKTRFYSLPKRFSTPILKFISTYLTPGTFDYITDISLLFAADRNNLPFKEIYHLYINKPWIDSASIILHSPVTEMSHIGKNLYKEKNLPIYFNRHSRQYQKRYPFDFDTLRHWLRQLIMRKSNFDLNHTPVTESLIRRRWIDSFKLFFRRSTILSGS